MNTTSADDRDRLVDEHLHRAGQALRRGRSVDLASIQAELGDAYAKFQSLISSQLLLHGTDASDALAMQHETIDAYRIVGELGSGTTAVVHDAVDPSGVPVAIKMLRPAWAAHKETRANFVREAKLLARSKHPNLVALQRVGECAGRPYLVLDRVRGQSLSHVAMPKDASEFSKFCMSAAKLVRGVAHMHAQGVVHRDIKPSNILVDEHGGWILADLGIAYDATTPVTPSLAGTGTPGYQSPQQLLTPTAPPVPSDDVYALGRTLLAVLTPNRTQTGQDFATRKGLGVTAAHALSSIVPAPLKRILARATRTRPEDRYTTADALAADLERTARALAGPRASSGFTTMRVGRTMPWKAIGVAAALVVAAIGGALFALKPGDTRLTIRSVPGAVASVDLGPEQVLPHTFSLGAGSRDVRVTAPRFRDRELAINVEAGSRHVVELVLVPKDSRDTQAMLDALRVLGLPTNELIHVAKTVPTTRSSDSRRAAVLFYPRGPLASSALDRAEFEWLGPLPKRATIHWRTSSKAEATPLTTITRSMSIPIPAAVSELLTAGTRLTWSVSVDEVELARAQCEVAALSPTRPTRVSEGAETPFDRVRDVLRLRREGRLTAALRRTFGVPESVRSPLLLRARMLVLRDLCSGVEGLASTELWRASYYVSRDVERSMSPADADDSANAQPRRSLPNRSPDEAGEQR